MSAPNIAGAPLPQRARGYWKARVGAAKEVLEGTLECERAQLPPWFVFGLGAGIAAWSLLDQAHEWAAFLCFSAATAVAAFLARGGRAERALAWFSLAMTLGCGLIWARSEWVAAPRLERPVVTSFDATVERVEPLPAKGDLRLTLRPSTGYSWNRGQGWRRSPSELAVIPGAGGSRRLTPGGPQGELALASLCAKWCRTKGDDACRNS